MIKLPEKLTSEGCEVRVLLGECKGPSFKAYSLARATECMQLMDLVLWNRLDDPAPFGARGATTLMAIVKARGQFAGFQNYPNYDFSIVKRIQAALDIANSARDKRSADFIAFINAALKVAKDPSIPDPSPGKLVAWRTAGSGSPGSNFSLHTTILGTEFYFIP